MSPSESLDISIPRTPERLEAYLRAFCDAHGITVEETASGITLESTGDVNVDVEILETAFSQAPDQRVRLRQDVDPDETLGKGELEFTPDSPLAQSLLESGARGLYGQWRITGGVESAPVPEWIQQSSTEIVARDFVGYYDRTAVCYLFDVSIETVSEYEKDLLVPICVDTESEEPLRGLGTWFGTVTSRIGGESGDVEPLEGEGVAVSDWLPVGRDALEEVLDPVLSGIREKAVRAANVEFEEYVSLKESEIESHRDEIARLETKLEELNDQLATADRSASLEAIEDQDAVEGELETLRTELEELLEADQQGFSNKQAAIRSRHSIEVQCDALGAAYFEYEKGDVLLTIVEGDAETQLRVGFGRGMGVMESVHCGRCEAELTAENPLSVAQGEILGRCCAE